MKGAKLFSTGILLLCQFIFSTSFAQQGKDGVGNILVANTIVNVYTGLTVNAGVGATSVSVASAAGFAAGDLVYLIQMQGATVKAYVWQFGNPNNSLPNDTSFGKVSAYNGSGNNEFAEVKSVAGNVLTFDCALVDSFGVNGKTQVIRVPRYTSLTITSPGTITSPLWNGTTGGVVVVEVQGNTTINAGASINVAGKGFRGGGILNAVGYGATNTGSNYDLTGANNNGAHKGESIVGDTTYYKTIHAIITNTYVSMPLAICKGNVANGGGGGNSMNCGGGGGSNGGVVSAWNGMGNPDNSTANNITSWNLEPAAPVAGSFRPTVSSGGGRGGYAFSSNNGIVADPTVTGPNNNGVWGSDDRHNDGGWGGVPLDYSGGKIFLGGGAGAGDSNDGNGTAGGNGGGIVYLMSYGTVTGAGQIIANGATAVNTNWVPGNTWNETPANGDDGAGGGGGGGAVFVNSVGAITLTNATPITATGGLGGNYIIKNVVSTTKNFGPGGGGGGGYVGTSNAVVNSVLGGNNGICQSGGGNNTRIATKFPPNGATRGGAGGSATITNFYLTTTNYTICAGSSASLSVTIGGTPPGGISVNWYNVVIGGAIIFTGNPYNTGALAVGTYTYYVGTCPGTYRAPVIVTVLNAPVVTAVATPTLICVGQSAVLTGGGATTYTWSANAGSATTATVSVSPIVNTTYTVTGANGNCISTQTVAVVVTASPTVTAVATPTAICTGQSAVLTGGGATTYTWSANAGSATTATVSVSPIINTTYTVTGANGNCISTKTVSLIVTTTPTVSIVASNTTICNGSSVTFTASGATTYTWSANAGSATTATVSVSPIANTTYTVTGANGNCISTQTVAVTVTPGPTVTTVATPTMICAGQSAVLTGGGATTYTWSANAGSATTATVSVSPIVNTTYTVTGANGTCSATQTVAVAVTAIPVITTAASNTTICNGSSVTFTANGATSYTWSANAGSATTATVTVSPIANTTYTVTGANGNCTSTQTVSIIVTPNPTVTTAATPTTICVGQSTVLTGSGATTYTWSANAGSATTATVSVSPITNTTYTVTGANGNCIATQTVAVNVTPSPTVTTAATPTTICSGQSTVLTGSGATTYTWSANAGSATTATVSVSPIVNTTYTVTGDNSGCTATQTVSVNVTTTPTVTATSNTVICNGSTVTFTASGATTYTWSANAGSATTNTVSVSPSSSTIYTVTGDNSGCVATQTVGVVVNMPPTKADSVANAASCNQSNGSYQINSVTGGTGPYQINFNGTGFTPIGSFTYTVPGLSAGIYSVIIQDNNGCTYTTSVNITNTNGITKIDSVITNASCNPSNNGLVLITSVTGGTGPYQVSVNGGAFTPMVLPDSLKNLTAGTYTVVVKDATGCLHPTLITVGSVAGVTQANTTAQNALCNPPNSGSIAITSVTGGVGPYQVSVNGGAPTTIASFPDSLLGLSAGSYSLSIIDANGCTTQTVVAVGSNGGPTAATDITTSDTCNRNIGTINVTSVTGGTPTYQYSLNGGAFQTSTTFTALAAGNYTVTVKDNVGCTFVITDSVKLAGAIPSPTVTASGPTTFCQGGSVILTSSSATGNTWSTSATTQTISVNASGTYSLSISQSGCFANSNTIAVTVNAPPTITATNGTICSGSTTTLTAGGASTYTWSPATGLSSTSGASVTANPTVTTAYTISGTDVNGCTSSSTATVIVNPTPLAPTVNPDTLYYCLYQNAPVLTTTVTGGATLTWYDASGNVLASAPTPTTNIIGTTTYYVSQNLGGCDSPMDSVKVIVVPGPNAAFSTNPSPNNQLPGQPIVFTPIQQYAYYSYSWNFGDPNSGSNTSNGITPSHTYVNAGAYCTELIIISAQTGCKDSSTLCYDVINGIIIEIPNVFSPNGDNINDVFSVKTEGISKLTCEIYDRWGIKLYGWDGITGHWDGTAPNGKTCSDGTYYYVIDATDIRGKNLKYNGYLQLLK